MATRPKITREDNCIYLTQDIGGMNIYDRAKAIVNFVEKETKELEKEIDNAILDIFEDNHIFIQSKRKSVLKKAFDTLNQIYHKDIKVRDLYKDKKDIYKTELIKTTDLFTIWLEDDTTLQVGIEICVVEINSVVDTLQSLGNTLWERNER